ncbi:MAG: shikimate dehydrogenase [Rhodospirillaceae bacterium]
MKPIKAGIMGWPVDHSRSPALHEFWLKNYGIEGSYVRLPVPPESLGAAIGELHEKGFSGVNLTVPHKETALSFLTGITNEARQIGAVNTIFLTADGKTLGTNTDAYGFITNLRAEAPTWTPDAGPAVVLGAGGAARAVCFALQDAGVSEIRLVNRTARRAESLALEMGPRRIKPQPWENMKEALDGAALLVNTTTLGMKGQPALEIDLAPLPPTAVVNDIVYVPLETPLLAAARTRKNPAVDGLGMLLYQAQPAFAGWFGVRPEVTPALRAHVLAA